MPLEIAQVFDLLLVLIVAMFVPIGLWRGALREWIALAGIGLGAALAAEWSGPWGGDLAAFAALDPRVARFAVGAALFLGTAFIVGYGAGLALPYRPDLSWPNRGLGAAVGVGNGLLILSNALRIMQRALFDDATDSPLLASALARFLIDYIGWVVLAQLVVLIGAVLAGAARRWTNRSPLLEEYAPVYYADWGEWADEEPAEAGREEDLLAPEVVERAGLVTWRAASAGQGNVGDGRLDAHAQPTAVLRQVPAADRVDRDEEAPGAGSPEPEGGEARATGAPAEESADSPAGPPSGQPPAAPAERAAEHETDAPRPAPAWRVVELSRPASRREPAGDQTLPRLPRPTGAERPPVDDEATLPALPRAGGRADDLGGNGATPPASPDEPGPWAARPPAVCANCGAAASHGSRYCPACGHLIGGAERRGIRSTT